jgi:integrase
MTGPDPDALCQLLQRAHNANATPPGDPAQSAAWSQAFAAWLAQLSSDHTRRAYCRAWRDLLDYTNQMPQAIQPADLYAWLDDLNRRAPAHARRQGQKQPARNARGPRPGPGLSASTVRQYLAGISSFYVYAAAYRYIDPTGHPRTLPVVNPALAADRPAVRIFGDAHYLSTAEARALLSAIPRDTVQGLRDYALFLMYLATGRRNSEVRTLRWGDFAIMPRALGATTPRVYYLWTVDNEERQCEIPAPVWSAVEAYLAAAGRLATLRPGDYIFTPLSDVAARLPNVDCAAWDRNRPLSMRQVGCLLKRYGRAAGLNPDRLHTGVLRYTAAMLRRQAGDDAAVISAVLGHANAPVTQSMLRAVQGRGDTSWATVAAMLGL